MAHLHMAQLAYLTQELLEHVIQANNLIMRTKYELDRMQQIMKTLCTVQEEVEKDWRDGQN